MSSPQRKRRRLVNASEGKTKDGASSEEMASVLTKARVVLVLCGSMNPITNLHLRMFGKRSPCLVKIVYINNFDSSTSGQNACS